MDISERFQSLNFNFTSKLNDAVPGNQPTVGEDSFTKMFQTHTNRMRSFMQNSEVGSQPAFGERSAASPIGREPTGGDDFRNPAERSFRSFSNDSKPGSTTPDLGNFQSILDSMVSKYQGGDAKPRSPDFTSFGERPAITNLMTLFGGSMLAEITATKVDGQGDVPAQSNAKGTPLQIAPAPVDDGVYRPSEDEVEKRIGETSIHLGMNRDVKDSSTKLLNTLASHGYISEEQKNVAVGEIHNGFNGAFDMKKKEEGQWDSREQASVIIDNRDMQLRAYSITSMHDAKKRLNYELRKDGTLSKDEIAKIDATLTEQIREKGMEMGEDFVRSATANNEEGYQTGKYGRTDGRAQIALFKEQLAEMKDSIEQKQTLDERVTGLSSKIAEFEEQGRPPETIDELRKMEKTLLESSKSVSFGSGGEQRLIKMMDEQLNTLNNKIKKIAETEIPKPKPEPKGEELITTEVLTDPRENVEVGAPVPAGTPPAQTSLNEDATDTDAVVEEPKLDPPEPEGVLEAMEAVFAENMSKYFGQGAEPSSPHADDFVAIGLLFLENMGAVFGDSKKRELTFE